MRGGEGGVKGRMCYMWDFIYHPQLWGISDNPGHLMPLRWRRFQSQLVTVFVSAEFSCFKQMNSQSHMDQNAFQMKWPCLLTPGETASYSQHANNADAGSMHVSALSLSLSLACARARERKRERETLDFWLTNYTISHLSLMLPLDHVIVINTCSGDLINVIY